MNELRPTPPVPTWLRFWAVLTVCTALPLVLLGAEVTTKKVGMADSKGFRAPWHLFTVSWRENGGLGFVIEHSHRIAGFSVGMCCIVLAVGLTFGGRGWYRLLGWIALVAVGAQGLLGIFRVDLNATLGQSLALIHGACAQFVIAVLVSVAVLSSLTWSLGSERVSCTLRCGSLALSLLIFTQIVFGAIVRHLLDPMAQRVHILLAFVVLGTVFWLMARIRQAGTEPAARRWCHLLAALVCVQPIFGVEAWIRRFGAMTIPDAVPSSLGLDIARTGHHVLGSLIFATSVVVAALLMRPAAQGSLAAETTPFVGEVRPTRQLEGAL